MSVGRAGGWAAAGKQQKGWVRFAAVAMVWGFLGLALQTRLHRVGFAGLDVLLCTGLLIERIVQTHGDV